MWKSAFHWFHTISNHLRTFVVNKQMLRNAPFFGVIFLPKKLWSRKFSTNLMYTFKLHYPAPQNAFSAFMLPSGGRGTFIVATFTIGQNWIAGLQQCILNLNCAKKMVHLIALTSMITHQNLNYIPNRILFRSILFSEASIEIERNFTKCWVNVSNWIPTRPLWNVNVFCKLGSDNTQSRKMLEGQNYKWSTKSPL